MERVYDTLFIGLQDIIRAKGNCHDIRSRFSQHIKRVVDVNKGIGDAGSTADLRMLWSAIVCLGLGLL